MSSGVILIILFMLIDVKPKLLCLHLHLIIILVYCFYVFRSYIYLPGQIALMGAFSALQFLQHNSTNQTTTEVLESLISRTIC